MRSKKKVPSVEKAKEKTKKQKMALANKPAFAKILSIGFECETHDLAKLNMSPDGKKLYNTEYLINKTYLERMKALNSRAYEIKDNPRAKPFVEVFNEPLYDAEHQIDENVTFQITNDIGETPFMDMLYNFYCGKDKVSKNKRYVFKPSHGKKELEIHFTNKLKHMNCGAFSGVEFIGTYFKPPTGKNVILSMFKEFCKRMIDHFSDLKEIEGDLLYVGDKTREKIGYLDKRVLYHKPDTNLYYLQTFDDEDPDVNQHFKIDDALFSPQTTFAVHAENLYEVLKSLSDVHIKTSLSHLEDIQEDMQNTLLVVQRSHNCALQLLNHYNKTHLSKKIGANSVHGKQIVNALMMIFYKMIVFNETYFPVRNVSSDSYFKDYLTFASRHTNADYYAYIKNVIHEKFKQQLSAEEVTKLLFGMLDQPSIVKNYMYQHQPKVFTFRPESSQDVDYGNLRKSYMSYFDFLESPTRRNNVNESGELLFKDYLDYKGFDTQSTRFPLKDNVILIEFRGFVHELRLLFNKMNVQLNAEVYAGFSIKELKEFVKLMDRPSRATIDKEYNPITKRFVKPCKQGLVRNAHFKCRKTLKLRERKKKNDS